MSTNSVTIESLEVGMKVLFHDSIEDVPDWRRWGNTFQMPYYLGKVNTVRKVVDKFGSGRFFIDEDVKDQHTGNLGWVWRPSVIKEIVYDDDFDEGEYDLEMLLR